MYTDICLDFCYPKGCDALDILPLFILCNWDILILFIENDLMLFNVDQHNLEVGEFSLWKVVV